MIGSFTQVVTILSVSTDLINFQTERFRSAMAKLEDYGNCRSNIVIICSAFSILEVSSSSSSLIDFNSWWVMVLLFSLCCICFDFTRTDLLVSIFLKMLFVSYYAFSISWLKRAGGRVRDGSIWVLRKSQRRIFKKIPRLSEVVISLKEVIPLLPMNKEMYWVQK